MTNRFIAIKFEYLPSLKALPPAELGELIIALMEYYSLGAEPQLTSAAQKIIWPIISSDVGRALEAVEKRRRANSENGKKSAQARADAAQRTNEIEPSLTIVDEPEPNSFDAFWDAYPRKQGYQDAYEAFLDADTDLQTLLQAISEQRFSEQWTRENGRYIPAPAKWLLEKRWKDKLPMPEQENALSEAAEQDRKRYYVQKLQEWQLTHNQNQSGGTDDG